MGNFMMIINSRHSRYVKLREHMIDKSEVNSQQIIYESLADFKNMSPRAREIDNKIEKNPIKSTVTHLSIKRKPLSKGSTKF